jgi:hypothetical protein
MHQAVGTVPPSMTYRAGDCPRPRGDHERDEISSFRFQLAEATPPDSLGRALDGGYASSRITSMALSRKR